MLIHFVGGFSRNSKLQLNELEQLCIARARLIYPDAKIKIWTQPGSWLNAPAYCIRHELDYPSLWHYPNFEIIAGEHLSDKVRIMVLIKEGGLYIDTDVLCLKPIDFIDSSVLIMAKEKGKGRKANNGIIYAPKPNSPFLSEWQRAYLEAKEMGSWTKLSTFVPNKIAKRLGPNYIDLRKDWYNFHGFGTDFFYNNLSWQDLDTPLPEYRHNAYFFHAMRLIGQLKYCTDKQMLGRRLISEYAIDNKVEPMI